MKKYLDSVDEKTIIHAFRNLNHEFYDKSQKEKCIKLFNYSEENLERLLSFEKIIHNKDKLDILIDILNYGLISYEKRYGSNNYGMPFFKLYEQYKMVDTALLSNYEKEHSSFRGSGLIRNGKEYFLFVDLHKDENIKESINYKDKFINRDISVAKSKSNISKNWNRKEYNR